MHKTKTIFAKRSFLEFLLLFTALFYFIKAESAVHAPVEFCYYANPTKIELVVFTQPTDDLNIAKFGNCAVPKSIRTAQDFSAIYNASLIQYDAYILQQLSFFKHSFAPVHLLNSILQKHNIWHQSSDEPPVLIS